MGWAMSANKSGNSSATPLRGEVWFADLEPVRGHEQGRQRPVLILSTDLFNSSAADLVFVLAITSVERKVRSHVLVEPPEGGLNRPSWVMCEQIRTIARERLDRCLGSVSQGSLRTIRRRLQMLLEL